MKYKFLTILSFIIGFSIINHIMADDLFTPYYYAGGSIGFANTKWDYAGFNSTGFAFGAYGGYQFNHYFAAEGQFTHFSKSTKSGKDAVKTNAIAAFLKGSIGLGQTKFKLFSKIGLGNVFNSGYSSKSHFGLAFAYGIDWRISKNLTAEAAYTHYIGKYSDNPSDSVPNVDYYSVGLAYTFTKNLFA